MMHHTVVNVPQLNSDNFNNWKFRVGALLEEKQLEDTLEKSIADFTGTKEIQEFKVRDAKAKSILVQCVSDKHLDIIKDAKSAKEMLKCLEDVFQRKSVFTKLTLKRKLLTLKHNRNEKLEDHFQTFDRLIRELESMGTKVEEEDKVCHLLLTLNDEYGAVITAIETLNQQVTMDFVKSRLLDEELKMKTRRGQSNIQNEASFKANPYTCYKCGKTGHKFADCHQNTSVIPRGSFRGRRGGNRGYYQNNRGQFRNPSHNSGVPSQQANKTEEISFVASHNMAVLTRTINTFILDSGCTQHMVMECLEEYMSDVTELESEVKIGTAKNKEFLLAKKKGTLRGICQGKEITIEALLVQGMTHNLISVSKLLRKNFNVTFDCNSLRGKCAILSKNDVNFYCDYNNDLFFLNIDFRADKSSYNNKTECIYNVSDHTDKNLWHRRLGHINRFSLRKLGLPYSDNICKNCIESKSTRKPFYKCEKKTKRIGELIHSDIAGPVATPTSEGHKYFQVLIDDYSHFLIVKILKHKSEAEQNIIDFIQLIKTQHGLKTQRIRLDNGGEFTSHYFKNFCKCKGIELEYTMPHTPQENGVSERMNRSLLDKVRTKFSETNLPKELWNEAIQCSAYELNRSPTEANNGETPAARWYKKLDLTRLRVFGSQAWAVILPRQNKLEKRAQSCIMIGYSGSGYRLWDYEKNEIFCSRDVRFNEELTDYNQICSKAKDKQIIVQIEENFKGGKNEIEIEVQEDSESDEDTIEESESSDSRNDRECSNTEKTSKGRIVKTPKHLEEYEIYTAYCLISAHENDPERYEDAIKTEEWRDAINNELKSHKKLKTWTEAELPEGKTAIETKWVFRTKEDGTKKARLVAKGFQIKEENQFETMYSPVARLSTIRTMLSIALQKDWNIRQLDIPTAFLNGELKSEVYIHTPFGLESKSSILRLNRALYGLKEAPKVWNDTFNDFATKNNFRRSKYDCCLYCSDKAWILIYVDDMLIVGKEQDIEEVVGILKRYFQAKDLGEVKNFLGMNIERSENKLTIDQKKFIEKLLSNFNMENCKPKQTPMIKGFQYSEESEIIDVPYRQLIGGLMYLSTTTRPDITYSVSYLSRFLDKPTVETWNASKRILRYLQGTKDNKLTYYKNTGDDIKLKGYSDADWATDRRDRKSVSGSMILLGENSISWFSKKQTCVALSTAEAEFVAAATCAQDLVNLKGILSEFKVDNETLLFCDNKSSILMSKSNENSKRAKHIDIKNYYLKDLILKGVLAIEYVSTDQNLADMLTKALCKDTFNYLRNKICII